MYTVLPFFPRPNFGLGKTILRPLHAKNWCGGGLVKKKNIIHITLFLLTLKGSAILFLGKVAVWYCIWFAKPIFRVRIPLYPKISKHMFQFRGRSKRTYKSSLSSFIEYGDDFLTFIPLLFSLRVKHNTSNINIKVRILEGD
jgi:hypothetical protein